MSEFVYLHTLEDLFRFFRLDRPVRHPLVAVVDFSKTNEQIDGSVKVCGDSYSMIFKHYSGNNVKYGRKRVDFQHGSLVCMSPQQIIELEEVEEKTTVREGWGLFFHPDFIRGTPLAGKMKEYNYFSYDVGEALHLSEKEKEVLAECVKKIDAELDENIDPHSQDILVSAIGLLLNYCSRFYGRQFITRKSSNHAVVAEVERLLTDLFRPENIGNQGLPTVKYLADQVHLSPGYLGDLLKKETGKNAQDHIHFHLIEEAKNILRNTDRSIGEIAYGLGFEYPQYFNKLFKARTGMTPVEFRKAG